MGKRGHNDKRGRGGIRFEDDATTTALTVDSKTGWSDGRRIGGKARTINNILSRSVDIQRVNLELLREEEAGDIAGQYIEKPKRTKNTNRLS